MRLALAVAPWLGLGALCLAGLAAFGVPPEHAIRFFAYEAAFAFAPGWVAYRVLAPGDRSLARQIAVGWALGYGLAIVAFNITASLGVRELFVGYPVIVLAVATARRRLGALPRSWPEPDTSRILASWALAGLAAIAVAYIAVSYFAVAPLPGSVPAVDYHVDLPYHLGLAVEALRHWPIANPSQAGEPLIYYTFTYSHLAASAQVTGIPLPAVMLRLYVISLAVLLVTQMYALGAQVGRSRLAGVLTVALMFLVGELDISLYENATFNNAVLEYLGVSPSFTLGLVFFAPTVLLTAQALKERTEIGRLMLIAMLLGLTAATKASPLPLYVGAFGLFIGVALLRRHRVRLSAWALGLAGAAVLAVAYITVYRHVEAAFRIAPFASVQRMVYFADLWKRLGATSELAQAAFDVAFAIPALLGFAAVQFLAVAWLARERRLAFAPDERWHAAITLAGVALFLGLSYSNFGQLLYLYYAMPSLAALAAVGLVGFASRLLPRPAPRRVIAAAAVAGLILIQLTDLPTDARLTLYRWRVGEPTYRARYAGLTTGLWQALTWLRERTSPDDVIAVNNQVVSGTIYVRPTFHNVYYSAFGERRVFHEGWEFRAERYRAFGDPPPYRDRFALNERIFKEADADAISVVYRDYGVRYLLVDKLHGVADAALSDVAERVFSNPDADIYALRPPP